MIWCSGDFYVVVSWLSDTVRKEREIIFIGAKRCHRRWCHTIPTNSACNLRDHGGNPLPFPPPTTTVRKDVVSEIPVRNPCRVLYILNARPPSITEPSQSPPMCATASPQLSDTTTIRLSSVRLDPTAPLVMTQLPTEPAILGAFTVRL